MLNIPSNEGFCGKLFPVPKTSNSLISKYEKSIASE